MKKHRPSPSFLEDLYSPIKAASLLISEINNTLPFNKGFFVISNKRNSITLNHASTAIEFALRAVPLSNRLIKKDTPPHIEALTDLHIAMSRLQDSFYDDLTATTLTKGYHHSAQIANDASVITLLAILDAATLVTGAPIYEGRNFNSSEKMIAEAIVRHFDDNWQDANIMLTRSLSLLPLHLPMYDTAQDINFNKKTYALKNWNTLFKSQHFFMAQQYFNAFKNPQSSWQLHITQHPTNHKLDFNIQTTPTTPYPEGNAHLSDSQDNETSIAKSLSHYPKIKSRA